MLAIYFFYKLLQIFIIKRLWQKSTAKLISHLSAKVLTANLMLIHNVKKSDRIMELWAVIREGKYVPKIQRKNLSKILDTWWGVSTHRDPNLRVLCVGISLRQETVIMGVNANLLMGRLNWDAILNATLLTRRNTATPS